MSDLYKNLICLEYLNHTKDFSYLLWRDHDIFFMLLLILTIIVPPIISWGRGGKTTEKALLGLGRDSDGYAKSRWLIKTNICIYENIPQIFIVLIETLYEKKTITMLSLILPYYGVIMSVSHLGLVTGEAF